MWASQNTRRCLKILGRISSSKRTPIHGLGDKLAYISVDLKNVTTYFCSCMILSLHCSFIYDQVISPLSLFLHFLIFLFRCMCSVCSYSGCERRQIVATDVSTCVSVSRLDIKSKAHVSICCHLFTNMSNLYMWMEMSLSEEMEVLKFVFN
jgi:hypothetical protein